MSDDVRQAAERLMDLDKLPVEQQKAHVREWPELGWDGIKVARAWLAEDGPDREPSTTELIAAAARRGRHGVGCECGTDGLWRMYCLDGKGETRPPFTDWHATAWEALREFAALLGVELKGGGKE